MQPILLKGINGQHLWGFLTSLGVLTLLAEHAHEQSLAAPSMMFHDDGSTVVYPPVTADQLPAVLLNRLRKLQAYLERELSTVKKPSDFTTATFDRAALESEPDKLNFLAGLACVIDDETSEATLCAANGASHQNLVQAMRDVLQLVEEQHIRTALFEFWQKSYRVPDDKRKQLQLGTRKPTLRFDPSDERLYALRFSNPTMTDDFKTELGAQALAIPAFSLLPVLPCRQPVTVGSIRHQQRATFNWPLWNVPATIFTVRSLLWNGIAHSRELRARGVFAAFRADRVSGAKGKLSFAPSEGVW